jgi:hypothetical protein
MWDASRSDPGDKRHGLAGTDARAGFKDDAEFDFRHRGTLQSGSSWSSRSFYSVGGADLTRRRYLAASFPTHRTLLQTAEITRRLKSAGTSFIERRKRG